MSTSFTKEWSDDDSSHSSEEFMYVKGTIEVEKIISPTDNGKFLKIYFYRFFQKIQILSFNVLNTFFEFFI